MAAPDELLSLCTELGITFTAFSPLGSGRLSLLEHETVAAVAAECARTPAQVLLRFQLQRGATVVTKCAICAERRLSVRGDGGHQVCHLCGAAAVRGIKGDPPPSFCAFALHSPTRSADPGHMEELLAANDFDLPSAAIVRLTSLSNGRRVVANKRLASHPEYPF